MRFFQHSFEQFRIAAYLIRYIVHVLLVSIAVACQLNHGFAIRTNEYLINSLFTNLISNSIRHTPDKGTITMILSPQFFNIKKTGIDTELDSSVIFNRFYRAGNFPGSSGLRLAIAKDICSTLHYKILYESIPFNMHSFSVCFNTDIYRNIKLLSQ